ncbi:hypothetical protein CaCOL14_007251 [Colletotrichum acutatum]
MDQSTSRSSRELTETRFTSPASAMTQPSTTSAVLNMSEKPLQPASDSDVEQTEKKEAGTEDEGSTAADQEEAEEEYIEGLKLILVLAALTLTVFLMMLDMSIITTAVPEITTAFNSLSDVGWYGAAYSLCGAALQPLAGKLYTHRHSKEIFLAFLFVFEAGSLICALSNSSTLFIIGRAVSGMGSGGLFNGSLTIIGATVPLEKRPLIIGIMIGISNIGIVAGPLVGGALTQYTTWRWCFYINLPIGAVTAAMLFLIHIPSKITKPVSFLQIPRHLDLPGFTLFAPAAIMFLLALQFGGNDYSWDSSVVIGLFVGAAVTAGLFIFWEHREGDDKAMVPMGLFKNRIVLTSSLVGALNMSITQVSSYYIPMYFQSVKGETPFRGGVHFLPTIIAQLVFAVASGALGKLTAVASLKLEYGMVEMLILRSREARILPPLGRIWLRSIGNRQWPHLYLGSVYRFCQVDWISSPPRRRPWCLYANAHHRRPSQHPARDPLRIDGNARLLADFWRCRFPDSR